MYQYIFLLVKFPVHTVILKTQQLVIQIGENVDIVYFAFLKRNIPKYRLQFIILGVYPTTPRQQGRHSAVTSAFIGYV